MAIQEIDEGGSSSMDVDMNVDVDGGMGSPEDMMGDEMSMGGGDDMVDAMADVQIDGDPDERPKKEL